MTKTKKRLDELMLERGLCENLHDARAAIMAGEVVVDEHRAESAGMRVKADVEIRLKRKKGREGFVSRGALKLKEALEVFGFDPKGLFCADLGASSGGFTDCLLKYGAAHVSAVDVGVGQFDWSLRCDERVSLFEHTNVREVAAKDIEGPFDLVVADLSFISLRTVMQNIAGFLKPHASFISLIKPQFEVPKAQVEKGGVVHDAACHVTAIERVFESAEDAGLSICALTYSPVKGPAGNIEFLFWAKNAASAVPRSGSIGKIEIVRVVEEAHATLGGNQ